MTKFRHRWITAFNPHHTTYNLVFLYIPVKNGFLFINCVPVSCFLIVAGAVVDPSSSPDVALAFADNCLLSSRFPKRYFITTTTITQKTAIPSH